MVTSVTISWKIHRHRLKTDRSEFERPHSEFALTSPIPGKRAFFVRMRQQQHGSVGTAVRKLLLTIKLLIQLTSFAK